MGLYLIDWYRFLQFSCPLPFEANCISFDKCKLLLLKFRIKEYAHKKGVLINKPILAWIYKEVILDQKVITSDGIKVWRL